MAKIKFLGTDDSNFKYNNIYILIKLDIINKNVHAIISNKYGEIVYIPYSNLALFNRNWEVVNE